MQTSIVTTKTIRFPVVNTIAGVAGSLVGYGIPGLPYQGVAVRQNGSGAKPVVPDSSFADPSIFGQAVQVPRPGGSTPMPLRAISIANDSALAGCLISIGGNLDPVNAYKVSVGCPLIGDFNSDYISVASVIPLVNVGASGGQWAWDGGAIQSTDAGQSFSWPLRLSFWWGDALSYIPAKRSPMHAAFTLVNSTGGASTVSFVCVDGRRRIRVQARTPAATNPTITINQLYGYEQTIAQPNFPSTASKVITGPTALAATVPFIFEIGEGATTGLETMGFPFMSVIVSDPTGDPLATALEVHAID